MRSEVDFSDFIKVIEEIEKSLKPYREGFTSFSQIPKAGLDKEVILQEIEQLNAHEQAKWKEGFVSGAVYHGDDSHIDFLNRVYALHPQSNPLHPDIWPSTWKFEAEIAAMTANMLNGAAGTQGREKTMGGRDDRTTGGQSEIRTPKSEIEHHPTTSPGNLWNGYVGGDGEYSIGDEDLSRLGTGDEGNHCA